MEIHERIKIIYKSLDLNQKNFALSIGMQPQTVGSLIRNGGKPSYDFLNNMFKTYPEINKDFVFGKDDKVFKEGLSINNGVNISNTNSQNINNNVRYDNCMKRVEELEHINEELMEQSKTMRKMIDKLLK